MDDLRAQLDRLERRVADALRGVPGAVALACFGSRAAGAGDGYADLDLLLVVDDLPAARAVWPAALGLVGPVRFALGLDAAPHATACSVAFAGESPYHKLDISLGDVNIAERLLAPQPHRWLWRQSPPRDASVLTALDAYIPPHGTSGHLLLDECVSLVRYTRARKRQQHLTCWRFVRGAMDTLLRVCAASLATSIPPRLAGRLPLATPAPITEIRDEPTGQLAGMGYPLLPGEPLWGEALAAIRDDAALDRMAAQLATFLRALHRLPLAEYVAETPAEDEAARWTALHRAFQAELYALIRPDARHATDALFAAMLEDLRRNPPAPSLIHGDFGGGNVLYDPTRMEITGVIDWGFAGPGDPASDIAALSCYGEDFLARGLAVYPEMAQLLARARLYRETFALQQALYARRDGDDESLADGLRRYV